MELLIKVDLDMDLRPVKYCTITWKDGTQFIGCIPSISAFYYNDQLMEHCYREQVVKCYGKLLFNNDKDINGYDRGDEKRYIDNSKNKKKYKDFEMMYKSRLYLYLNNHITREVSRIILDYDDSTVIYLRFCDYKVDIEYDELKL